jgi:hypothetical protein
MLYILGILSRAATLEMRSIMEDKRQQLGKVKRKNVDDRNCQNILDLSYNGIQILLGIALEIEAELASVRTGANHFSQNAAFRPHGRG